MHWKDLDTGKDWGEGVTEDEMVGWHHLLKGHEFEQTLGESEGQGNLACCQSWACKDRHDWATERRKQSAWGHEAVEMWVVCEYQVHTEFQSLSAKNKNKKACKYFVNNFTLIVEMITF